MIKPTRAKTRTVEGFDIKAVLVVDDDPGMRDLISNTLAYKDYNVMLADNAEDGVAMYAEIRIDLVIIDIFMRGKGGIWGIQELRKIDPEVKIIALSGGWKSLAAAEVVKAAQRAGANAMLTKPFQIAELERSVEFLIGKALTISI